MSMNSTLAQPREGISPARLKAALASWRAEIGVGIALAALIIYFSATASNFLTVANFATLLTQTSVVAMIAVGMTMVIIAGEIDLSVGATVGLAGTVMSLLVVKLGWSLVTASALAVGIAVLIGAFIGALRVIWAIPSFITTLGLLSALRGVAFYISDGLTIGPMPKALDGLWYGSVLGLPTPVVLMAGTIGLGWLLLSQLRFGRYLYAVGGNPITASRYGVPVRAIRIAVFIIVQVLAAIGGIMLVSRLNSGSATVGEHIELDVIAAVIVGGTSLNGGYGRLVGTVLGVMFVAVLRNGMVLAGIDPIVFLIAQGLVIILAVWWSMLRRQRTRADGFA
ncbi:ABC transporter permease [Bradyrhizobium neotropicale]|uniref:ABC transporter permease n=1 Tax=Bradyrhizobium neotropicale TaxID=1497615 RepID=UPI001AD7DCAC|nr:ABC transporter permease [Bradyrhizobium neotropicale]MBO4223935.1 ABC transporter permease [Bradyrhizobium neotropicale]